MVRTLTRTGAIFVFLTALLFLVFTPNAFAVEDERTDSGRIIAAAAQVDLSEIKSPNGTPTFLYRLDGSDGSVRFAYGRFEAPQMASSHLATYA